jgi:arylsulfatase A-like enzyme
MKRRDFIKSTTAVLAGASLSRGFSKPAALTAGGGTDVPGPQPNILFILVDELRYPTVFPGDIKTPGEFLKNFMPNVHSLWTPGVKFDKYYTAGNACTPSRGVLITGLYSQQNWLITTILSTPYPRQPPPVQPVLNPLYPTYGKLLRAAGYRTPYVGKWHVSVPPRGEGALIQYGFDYFKSYYDPTGANLQGTYGDEHRGYHNDHYVVTQAIDWLQTQRPERQPWCLTVSLVNPHDREFFPAGTEFRTYNELFLNDNPNDLKQIAKYPGDGPVVPWHINALKSPRQVGYPAVPPNWEDADSIRKNKPRTQNFFREFQQGVWGGITDDRSQANPVIVPYRTLPDQNFGVLKMPYSYWERGLDSYTQIMQIVDGEIGRLLNAVPENVKENTVIVFTSDHGEYSGAHGFVQGKMGTVYEEAWRVPLIVSDPSGRFTGQVHQIRSGFVSSVDLSTLLVSIGNNGSRDWMNNKFLGVPLSEIYGNRLDVIPMLQSADAPGRPFVLYATDEIVPNFYNPSRAPTHVLGVRTEDTKLGFYDDWFPGTSKIIPVPDVERDLEFYDLSTPEGALEIDNTAASDPRAKDEYQKLINYIIPNELQQPLPGVLGIAQAASKAGHLAYREIIAHKQAIDWIKGDLTKVLGYGAEF